MSNEVIKEEYPHWNDTPAGIAWHAKEKERVEKARLEKERKEKEIADREQFQECGRTLRALQIQIEDSAREAAIRIGKLRALYQHKYEERRVFLVDYYQRHAKINKHGEMAKSYKDKETGFGVYYTKTPRSVYIPDSVVGHLLGLITDAHNGDDPDSPDDFAVQFPLNDLIETKTVTTTRIIDNDKFVQALEALKIAPEDYNIEIKEENPFGRMGVGGPDGAWSPAKLKTGLTKAIDGTVEIAIDEDEE